MRCRLSGLSRHGVHVPQLRYPQRDSALHSNSEPGKVVSSHPERGHTWRGRRTKTLPRTGDGALPLGWITLATVQRRRGFLQAHRRRFCGIDVSLYFTQSDWSFSSGAVPVKNRVIRILPSLVSEAVLRLARIFHKSIAI